MASPDSARRLIVNADDFGRSRAINEAVLQAHRRGILTSASLMVTGEAVAEAVEIARAHPTLGVGLHLTLVCGSAVLPSDEISGLADRQGHFGPNAVWEGMRYFFNPRLRPALQREMAAQFRRFQATGLTLDHLNGHLNLHLHPVVFPVLMRHAADWGIRHFRLTRDPFRLNARLASGRWISRGLHAWIFRVLSARAQPVLARLGIRHTGAVFGLLQNAAVDETFLERLLPALPPGDSELYSHPSLDESRPEFEALVSPRVRQLVNQLGIRLIRYRDL